jgi:hypothetical protein
MNKMILMGVEVAAAGYIIAQNKKQKIFAPLYVGPKLSVFFHLRFNF